MQRAHDSLEGSRIDMKVTKELMPVHRSPERQETLRLDEEAAPEKSVPMDHDGVFQATQ